MIEKHWFYAPDIAPSKYILSEDESHHCNRVLRLTEGAEVFLADGRGSVYRALISRINKKTTEVDVISVESFPAPESKLIHLAVAPTKNSARYEWFVEKATEIGVGRITPLICENSERHSLRTDRLQKIIVAACKQSRQTWFPDLGVVSSFSEMVSNSQEEIRLIALCDDSIKQGVNSYYNKGVSVLLLTGPEGDFSLQETELALKAGFKAVSLGNTRLRTETAAVVACNTFQFINTFL